MPAALAQPRDQIGVSSTPASVNFGSVTITSDAVNSSEVITLSGAGIEPPHSVQLDWDPTPSPVFGYYVYRATDIYGSYVRLNPTPVAIPQYVDFTVEAGLTYHYWVTAVDPNTVQSLLSEPVTVTIPSP